MKWLMYMPFCEVFKNVKVQDIETGTEIANLSEIDKNKRYNAIIKEFHEFYVLGEEIFDTEQAAREAIVKKLQWELEFQQGQLKALTSSQEQEK